MLSRSVLAEPAPSAPLAGTSRLHRKAAYTRCLRCAGAPRRPASGSGLSLPFRPDMPSSLTPGSSSSHLSSVAMPTRPSPRSERLGTPNTPAIRFTRGSLFEASLVRVCYGLSGCSPPWTDRTKFPWPTGDFYIQASGGSVALPAAGYDYNSTGLLCWRDFHPQEWQLASSSVKNSSAIVWQGLKVGSAYSFSPAFEAYSAKSLRFRALAYEPSSVSARFMVACSSA